MALNWAGTWSVRATYPAECMFSSLGGPRNFDADDTVSAQITGANDDLTAVLAGDSGYTMTGSGRANGLTLSGVFPGRDHDGDSATTVRADNRVTITIDEVVDANTARGTLSGRYDTAGGISCIIEDGGTVEMTR